MFLGGITCASLDYSAMYSLYLVKYPGLVVVYGVVADGAQHVCFRETIDDLHLLYRAAAPRRPTKKSRADQ